MTKFEWEPADSVVLCNFKLEFCQKSNIKKTNKIKFSIFCKIEDPKECLQMRQNLSYLVVQWYFKFDFFEESKVDIIIRVQFYNLLEIDTT